MSRRTLLAAFVSFAAYTGIALGDPATQVNLSSGSFTLQTNLGVDLSPGSALEGNGTVIQLGYFSSASIANNFLGTWIPLTGEGSANTGPIDNLTINFNQTSIGDSFDGTANTPGTFAFPVIFDNAESNTSQNLPGSTTIPLAIRFFDATTIAGSTFYNTVSNDSWLWVNQGAGPIYPTINISLDDAGLAWESIDVGGQAGSSAFKTTLVVVPEPSSLTMVLLGMVGLIGSRRRRAA